MPRIVPNLWFDTEALEAAEFYVSVFPNSNVNNVNRYGPDAPMPEGTVLTVDFELDGTRFTAINGGPQFTFSEAVSFVIDCADQAEVDYYWDRLCDGGQPDQCGWLKDRYGLSWQVIPAGLGEVLGSSDPERSRRAFAAMMTMTKLDIDAMRAAADGND